MKSLQSGLSINHKPTLSICLACRDRRESERNDIRGGTRLADAVCDLSQRHDLPAQVRGVHCMSQCKRPCIVSLTAPHAFTYVFGDLDPEDPAHIQAILELIPLYCAAPEGMLSRGARPKVLQASILGRLPPIGSNSDLVSDLSAISHQQVEL